MSCTALWLSLSLFKDSGLDWTFVIKISVTVAYYSKDLRVSLHFWRTSFSFTCRHWPDGSVPLLVLAGLVHLEAHSEPSSPTGWQMPRSEPLSSWWVTSCQWKAWPWYCTPIWMWPWAKIYDGWSYLPALVQGLSPTSSLPAERTLLASQFFLFFNNGNRFFFSDFRIDTYTELLWNHWLSCSVKMQKSMSNMEFPRNS